MVVCELLCNAENGGNVLWYDALSIALVEQKDMNICLLLIPGKSSQRSSTTSI